MPQNSSANVPTNAGTIAACARTVLPLLVFADGVEVLVGLVDVEVPGDVALDEEL